MANLKPFSSVEQAREMGRKGGAIAGRRRTEAKTLREALKAVLSTRIPKTSQFYPKLKAQMDAMGLKGDPNVMMMPVLGLINKAAKGSPEAFSVMRDTIGEKPKDVVEQTVQAPPVVLGVFNPSRIAEERAKQEAKMAEIKEAAQLLNENDPSAHDPVSAPVVPDSVETSATTDEPLTEDPHVRPTEATAEAPKAAVKPAFFAPPRRG